MPTLMLMLMLMLVLMLMRMLGYSLFKLFSDGDLSFKGCLQQQGCSQQYLVENYTICVVPGVAHSSKTAHNKHMHQPA